MQNTLRPSVVKLALSSSPQFNSFPPLEIQLLSSRGLMRLNLEEGGFEKDMLLDSKPLSPTLLQLTLKNNLQWSNHRPFTAESIIESWKQVLLYSPNRSLLFPIKNARAFSQKKANWKSVGIVLRDSKSIDIHFEAPTPDFLKALAHPATWPITNSTQSLGDHRILESSPGRWLLASGSQTLEFRYLPQEKERARFFQEEQFDFAEGISTELAGTLGLTPQFFPDFTFSVLDISPTFLPERTTRQLFSKAVDRIELRKMVKASLQPACYLPPLFECQEDPPAEAIQPLGTTVNLPQPLKLSLENPEQMEEALNLQAQWLKKLRIKAEIGVQESHFAFRIRRVTWSPFDKDSETIKLNKAEETNFTQVVLHRKYQSGLARTNFTGIRRHPAGIWDFSSLKRIQ